MLAQCSCVSGSVLGRELSDVVLVMGSSPDEEGRWAGVSRHIVFPSRALPKALMDAVFGKGRPLAEPSGALVASSLSRASDGNFQEPSSDYLWLCIQ